MPIMRLLTFIKKAYGWLKREPQKNLNHGRYKVWLSFKQISFKGRDEKIRQVEEILRENSNIYFTTDLVKTGFTDQMVGFDFLYKLGRGLGLSYYHTPLSAHRSSDPFLHDPITQNHKEESKEFKDIFDFLGVNEYLGKQSADVPQPRKEIYLNLNITLFGSKEIDSYEVLMGKMKEILYPFLNKNRTIILCLFAEPKTYFEYYRYLHDRKEHEIDYFNCFKNMGSRWQSEFDSHSINMLVHIRQGDTGTVKTPWNTFIPVWYEIDGKFTQFNRNEDIPGTKRVDPDIFYHFLREFQQAFAKKELSTVIFSDGYKKTFRWIYKYSREKDISIEEIEKLKELEPKYDDLQFGAFNNLQNTHTVIGEEVEKLYSLVQSFFDADIIVTGTQAVMMPKFLATFGKKDRMPFLIVLYHTQRPYLQYVGFKDSDPFLMLVDINNYDVKEIADQASEYLKSRKEADA